MHDVETFCPKSQQVVYYFHIDCEKNPEVRDGGPNRSDQLEDS